MTHRLHFADWVAFPVPRVFAFFSNPENLPRLMPPETATKVDSFQLVVPSALPGQDAINAHHFAGKGSIIDTSFRPIRFLSWRRKWTAAITEFEWNQYFADMQMKGPFHHWHHRHEFIPEARIGIEGTLVRDVIDYEVGLGPLGAVANSLFIERRMREIFAYRQKILPDLLRQSTPASGTTKADPQ